jgi:hypothetical protein
MTGRFISQVSESKNIAVAGNSTMSTFNNYNVEEKGQENLKSWEDFINKVEKTSPKRHGLWYSNTEIALLTEINEDYSYVVSYTGKEDLDEVLKKYKGKAKRITASKDLAKVFKKVSQGYVPKKAEIESGNISRIEIRCALSTYPTSPQFTGETAEPRIYVDTSFWASIDQTQYGMYGFSCPICNANLLLLLYPPIHHSGLLVRLLTRMIGSSGESYSLSYRLLRPKRDKILDIDENKLINNFLKHTKGISRMSFTSGVLQHSVKSINDKKLVRASMLNRKYPKGLNRVFRDKKVTAKRISSLFQKAEKIGVN